MGARTAQVKPGNRAAVIALAQQWPRAEQLVQGNYRGAVPGLYLCGSGTHPGGGVTGLPGRNAAREVLRDCGRRLRG